MAKATETSESLKDYRLVLIEEMGFSHEDSLRLVEATKLVVNKANGRTYFYDVPISWHDVAKLIEAGATHDQVLRILL